jgi:hypothetical protein
VRAAPNWEMVADWWVSPWGGGDGDGGGRKRAEDRSSSGVMVTPLAMRRVGKASQAQTKKKGTTKGENRTVVDIF